jgi:hypothetical protein
MENNNIIPFTMEIKGYHSDGTYEVEYRPTDPEYMNIQLAIGISLTDTAASTTEQILNRLAACSPQEYWKQQALAKTFDDSVRKSLVGQVHEDAQTLLPEPVVDMTVSDLNPMAQYLPISNSTTTTVNLPTITLL